MTLEEYTTKPLTVQQPWYANDHYFVTWVTMDGKRHTDKFSTNDEVNARYAELRAAL